MVLSERPTTPSRMMSASPPFNKWRILTNLYSFIIPLFKISTCMYAKAPVSHANKNDNRIFLQLSEEELRKLYNYKKGNFAYGMS